jgi:hypothetical protein
MSGPGYSSSDRDSSFPSRAWGAPRSVGGLEALNYWGVEVRGEARSPQTKVNCGGVEPGAILPAEESLEKIHSTSGVALARELVEWSYYYPMESSGDVIVLGFCFSIAPRGRPESGTCL